MGHVFVVVRALWEQLVFDVDTGDAGLDKLAHGAHCVQWLAKAGTGIR